MASGGWRIDTSGLSETIQMLENVTNIKPIQKMAIYGGADIVADEMRRQVSSLKTSKNLTSKNSSYKRYALEEDKAALESALGIAKFKETSDSVNTKVGFSGYFEGKTQYNIPLPLVANSINKGTSFMHKQPFVDKTVKACYKKCIGEMEDIIDKEFKRLLKK